jgi:hypothetical protein
MRAFAALLASLLLVGHSDAAMHEFASDRQLQLDGQIIIPDQNKKGKRVIILPANKTSWSETDILWVRSASEQKPRHSDFAANRNGRFR